MRNPAQVLGDVHSFVAANAVGAERLTAFMSEYGIHDLEALAAVLQGRSEKAMREAIAALPDGVYTSEVWNNPLGTPLRYPVKLTVKGDTIEVDFEGAPPQLPQGGLNCTLNYAASHATYPLKCMLTPNVRGNAGCYRAFTVKAPEGERAQLRQADGGEPAHPHRLVHRAEHLHGARQGGARPRAGGDRPAGRDHDLRARRGRADLFGPSVHGRRAGRLGSRRRRVGAAVADVGRQHLDRAARTARAGAGHREGLCAGLRRPGPPSRRPRPARQRAQARRATACRRSLRSIPEGVGIEVPGLFGGKPGRSARGVVRDAAGAIIHDCGTGQLVSTTTDQEIVEVCLSGGSGFGSPFERPLATIARDLAEGYVTPEAAARDYGVVIGADGKLDMAQSASGVQPGTAAE